MISAVGLFQPARLLNGLSFSASRPRFGAEPKTKNPILGERYITAMAYAARAHQSQLRKGTEVPYVSHLQAVASLVLEDGGTEDEAIAAWLHDVVEDQGGWTRLKDIRQKFGDPVADIVAGCSDAFSEPPKPLRQRIAAWWQHSRKTNGLLKTIGGFFKELFAFIKAIPARQTASVFQGEKPDWTQRKKNYIEHLATASPSVLRVSSCDKLHNARCLLQDARKQGDAMWGKFNGGKIGTLWYYDALLKAYSKRGLQSPVIAELGRVINELKQLAGVSDDQLIPPSSSAAAKNQSF